MKKELIVSAGIALGATLSVILTNLNELTGNQIVIKITVAFLISFFISFLLLHFCFKKDKKH